MAELKTKENDASVDAFLHQVENEEKRADCFTILNLMKKITKAEPKMWGSSIIGFGNYRYKYATGRQADWFYTGFSPRKQNLTLYIMSGFTAYESLLKKIGKHSTGKGCLYFKKLNQIDLKILEELITKSVNHLKSSEK